MSNLCGAKGVLGAVCQLARGHGGKHHHESEAGGWKTGADWDDLPGEKALRAELDGAREKEAALRRKIEELTDELGKAQGVEARLLGERDAARENHLKVMRERDQAVLERDAVAAAFDDEVAEIAELTSGWAALCESLKELPPGTPVPICGWCGEPAASDAAAKAHAVRCPKNPAVQRAEKAEADGVALRRSAEIYAVQSATAIDSLRAKLAACEARAAGMEAKATALAAEWERDAAAWEEEGAMHRCKGDGENGARCINRAALLRGCVTALRSTLAASSPASPDVVLISAVEGAAAFLGALLARLGVQNLLLRKDEIGSARMCAVEDRGNEGALLKLSDTTLRQHLAEKAAPAPSPVEPPTLDDNEVPTC